MSIWRNNFCLGKNFPTRPNPNKQILSQLWIIFYEVQEFSPIQTQIQLKVGTDSDILTILPTFR